MITDDKRENQKSTGYLSVMGISRMSKRKLVEAQRFVARGYVSKRNILSEQSTDEGKPSNETSLNSEAHGAAAVTTIVSTASGRGGWGGSTAEINGSTRDRFNTWSQLTWTTIQRKK